MKIEYLGHASFLLTSGRGTRIIMDPLDPKGYPGQLYFKPFDDYADVITISHEHADHGSTYVVKGAPVVIKGNGKFQANDAEFLGVETFHDKKQGQMRGGNTVFIVTIDGLRIGHFGDLGHVLTADQAAQTGAIDVALVPVGGNYTIDAAEAHEVAEQVDAKIVVPMHYKSKKCSFPIDGVEKFTEGRDDVIEQGSSELEVTKDSLPENRQIIVLETSL